MRALQAMTSPFVRQSAGSERATSLSPDIVQRSCACGGAAGFSGTCSDCQRQKLHGKPMQTKLAINEPGDVSEQEADRVAERVMRMPAGEVGTKQRDGTARSLIQRREMGNADGVADAPPIVHDVLSSPGHPLDAPTRAFFEPRFGHDFSHVRVHAGGRAAQSARDVSARAYTVGGHIVFDAGLFSPESRDGRLLLAHELAHVVQQAGAFHSSGLASGLDRPRVVLQRQVNEADLAKQSAADIMREQDYIENNMKSIEFYQAELAVIHYQDGSQLRLGLVPEWIESPIEGVDYRTFAEVHRGVLTEEPGALKFIPRGTEIEAPPTITYGEFLELTTQTVRFRVEPGSGKIVPTEVNSLTAPRLCAVLREAESQYVKNFDAMAEGTVEALEKLGIIVTLASLLTPGGALGRGTAAREAGKRGAAGRAGASAAAGVAARAEKQLLSKFGSLLKSGATETMTIEGVKFVNVRVALKGGELLVRRLGIQNVSRLAGQGRLVHAAYEQAAIAAARQAGATSARVALETVVNQSWKTYLQSRGYGTFIIDKVGGKGFEVLLAKVFPL